MNVLVLPLCICLPLTHSLSSRTCGSGISVRSAMYGPTGAEVAGAHVVDDRVAPDVVERPLLRHEARGAPDHDAELDLPVEHAGAAGSQDRLARIEDRVRPLREDRRLLR